MTRRPRALLAWSSGKDSAWALHLLRARGEVEVVGLLTTVGRDDGRVPMHRVPEELVEAQAVAAGLPLTRVRLPSPCPNEIHDELMAEAMAAAAAAGITAVAFGDIHLEDVRRYRAERLGPTGLRPCFPLWGLDPGVLAREMVAAGLLALVTCVDTRRLDRSFAGRPYDLALLDALREGVDPCGERGELHTFVQAGPMLAGSIPVEISEVVEGDGYAWVDLALGRQEPADP